MDTVALNCLVFEKIAFLQFGDRQTNGQTDGHHRCVKPQSRYRELWLNKRTCVCVCELRKREAYGGKEES